MRDSTRRLVLGISFSLAALCACHEGDMITDPRTKTPAPTSTPTPPAAQLAGTWTGSFGDGSSTFTTTVTQSGSAVAFTWTSSTYGTVRFDGSVVNGDRIRGYLKAEHDSKQCPIGQPQLTGTATTSRINLSGTTLCGNFDVFRVSVELTR
jgi:hypothetical protein